MPDPYFGLFTSGIADAVLPFLIGSLAFGFIAGGLSNVLRAVIT